MSLNHQDNNQPITTLNLAEEKCAGHSDHWQILTQDPENDVPLWLQNMIDKAVLPSGLSENVTATENTELLIAQNDDVHIKQILQLKDNKPNALLNAFPCVNSPYGLICEIENSIVCNKTLDTVLRLKSEDGTVIYAFDQLYTVNRTRYQKDKPYYVNFSAWAYNIDKSSQEEVILVEDQDAIRYHRAFNDIVAENNGTVPDDIEQKIKQWQPDTDGDLAPVEINLGNMCAYLFGEQFGQEDEAWCQGQVLGKQNYLFNDKELMLFDVVILREADSNPLVIRLATPATETAKLIEVQDYIQANIWLQAAIYKQNQTK